MTPDRKRAIMIIAGTLTLGILIGALIMAIIGRQMRRQPAGWREEGKDAFIQRILSVADADSLQRIQMRPLILETIAKIDTLQKHTDIEVRSVVDSLAIKLRPILNESQLEQLNQFHMRNRERRRPRR